jgi:plastocyanin
MATRLAVLLFIIAALGPVRATAAAIEAQVRDSSGNPVADAVVYAAPASGPVEARASRTMAVEQVDREFVPYVSVIQTGTAVTFPNRDAILHHVYSFSPAKSFEFKLYTGKSPSEVLFDKPGVVTLGCNIHDWMIAYILVVSTPYFARTDDKGMARIRDIPAGSYELRAWHPNQRAAAESTLSMAAMLEAATQLRPAFVVDLAPRKPRYKPPLDRLKY